MLLPEWSARVNQMNFRDADTKHFEVEGTAITISRVQIAIQENYQQADGFIVIPEVLRKLGKEQIGASGE